MKTFRLKKVLRLNQQTPICISTVGGSNLFAISLSSISTLATPPEAGKD
jgi:hypothetical protein